MKKGNLGRDEPQSGVSQGQIRTIEGWAIDEAAEVVAVGQDGFGRPAQREQGFWSRRRNV
jgi:hypothetical protein